MFKDILEKSGLKNELGPYEILDIGSGGLNGTNTTNHLLEYFDRKKHSITIHHWSEWESDKGTTYCENIDDVKEIDTDFYSHDYGDKKFDLIVIDMPSDLNMRDWEEGLLKGKIFNLLNDGGHVITYVMNSTGYATLPDNDVSVLLDTLHKDMKNTDVDVSKTLEVLIENGKDIIINDTVGNTQSTIKPEQLSENLENYTRMILKIENHMKNCWDVETIQFIRQGLTELVPFKTNQDLNHNLHDESIDHSIKRRIDTWYYYFHIFMQNDIIEKKLKKEFSDKYILKNTLKESERHYITWVDMENKNKKKFKHKITTAISTNNNFEYLKLAIKSVRQNCYYKDMPLIVHAENCNDGTDEWLKENGKKYDITYYIDHNDNPKGIGGGMDFCVSKTKTEFINIIHSDMWVAPNQDLELLKLYDNIDKDTRLIASSYRIQPRIFPNDPDIRPGCVFHDPDTFGVYHHDFNNDLFDEWATEFSETNNLHTRKAGGAGFFCRVEDYKWIGGNDPLFAPASWEDMDLFSRMQRENYQFKMTTKSVVWHFSARGSHFRDEAKDDFTKKSTRQQDAERKNVDKWVKKWGRMPDYDEETFVIPIDNLNVPNRIEWEWNDESE